MNVYVVNFPASETGSRAAVIPTSNLLNILSQLAEHISIITGGYSKKLLLESVQSEIQIIAVHHETGSTQYRRAINYIHTQLRIGRIILDFRSNIDILIFFMMGQDLIIPMLAAKLFGKKVVLFLALSSELSSKSKNDPFIAPLSVISKINYYFSDFIVLYSQKLVGEWDLINHKDKILIAREHFLNFKLFYINKSLSKRDILVGYIGRLSEEKGLPNFIKSIQEISAKVSCAEFLIVGDGHLRVEIENYLISKNLINNVKLTGWIPHDELAEYLNQLKLLVLPSYTEGLPNIMLEAMACGTPVLATPVGAIPDIIKDGETGFLMENNSPECIAANVIRALEHPDLEGVADRARVLVEQEFTFEKAVERWRAIL